MILTPGKYDKYLVFNESFRNRESIQSRGGLVVACQNVGNGISPAGASGRVTFAGTENVGINASKMTWELRFRTPSVLVGTKALFCKTNAANTNVQWGIYFSNTSLLITIANALNDISQYAYGTAMSISTEYTAGIVFDGGLAANLRAKMYMQGASDTTTISGAIPAVLTMGSVPISVLNKSDGSTLAPPTDTFLRSVSAWSGVAFSAQECADRYAQTTYSKLSVGGGA